MSSTRQRGRCAALAILVSATLGTGHAAAERSWLLGVAAQVDDESNDNLLATVNWGLNDATWLSFAAGQSRASGRGADVRAQTLEAAVDHRFGVVGFELSAERWGDPDSVESSDLGASIYVQKERFRLALEHEARDIDIRFTVTGPLGRTLERTAPVDADGTGLSLRVTLARRWQLFARRLAFDYDRDLTLVPRIDRLNLLSTSALTLAHSFIDETSTLGIEWAGDARIVSFGMSRDRSAVDAAELEALNGAVLFPVGRRMDLELNLGHSDSDVLGTGLYGGVLLLVYGGE